MKYIKGTFVCLACWPKGDQNLTKEKVTLGKIYFSRTLTKPHKSRMGAAAAQRVQAYMKRKEGKLLKLFDLILLKNLDICAGKRHQSSLLAITAIVVGFLIKIVFIFCSFYAQEKTSD